MNAKWRTYSHPANYNGYNRKEGVSVKTQDSNYNLDGMNYQPHGYAKNILIMQEIAMKYPEKSKIQDICKNRKIEELVHFSQIENLHSIITRGLLTRDELRKRGIEYKYNDNLRLDNRLNTVSLSISFPNYKMFYKYRNQKKVDWVVVSLKPDILWELDCAFLPTNAASSEVKKTPIEQYKKPEALEYLFNDYYGDKRRYLELPYNYTTNPQAEILVFGDIAPSYIRKVYFENDEVLNNWLRQYGNSFQIDFDTDDECFEIKIEDNWFEFKVSNKYFKPREDYSLWTKELDKMIPAMEEPEFENPFQWIWKNLILKFLFRRTDGKTSCIYPQRK
ncbi:DarT ssDNA thymidine ADP-ribosyltransferase family protein [Thermanaerothrix sp.]|uniref:DarT ssDNA thymidine ADP-ribosyltransferase family protein n=1 Tax=Thermanaerothrix sp. TaxID=2972675 RepID=UPI003C7D5216